MSSISDNNAAITVSGIEAPSTIYLRKGTVLNIKADINNKIPIPSEITVSLDLQKKMWFWVPIPCGLLQMW